MAFTAAFVALLMLSYASVQSGVMQMAMAAGIAQPTSGGTGAPAMAAMAGMSAAPAKPSAGASNGGHAPARSCPYCAAAAHAPIVGTVAPWRASSVFTFAAFQVVASHGPRGPPACQPRARGPPADPLTV